MECAPTQEGVSLATATRDSRQLMMTQLAKVVWIFVAFYDAPCLGFDSFNKTFKTNKSDAINWLFTFGSTDVNECDRNPCGRGVCQNVFGSFTCTCDTGFRLSDNGDCVGALYCAARDVMFNAQFTVSKITSYFLSKTSMNAMKMTSAGMGFVTTLMVVLHADVMMATEQPRTAECVLVGFCCITYPVRCEEKRKL